MLSLGSLLVPRLFSAELPARWRSIFVKQHKTWGALPSMSEDSGMRKYWAGFTIYDVSCYLTGYYFQGASMQCGRLFVPLFLWDSSYTSSSVTPSSSKKKTELASSPALGHD